MKKTLFVFALTFSVMFSSSSYAGWTMVSISDAGDTFFVDFERIKKLDEYVYYWTLLDYLKPTEYGTLSSKHYIQGDCKLFRFKQLSASFHNEPMGGGTGDTLRQPDKEWSYPPPNTSIEEILQSVCNW